MMQQRQHILIVGAGISGLALAHGLQKAGISYSIFEREEQGCHRSRDWTISLNWGLPLLEQLLPDHLASKLLETTADPTLDILSYPNNHLRIIDGRTGDITTERPYPGRVIRVSRQSLRKLLSDDLDIKYSHTLESISYNDDDAITIHFTNGTTATGSTLVGADGSHSMVRAELVGSELSRTTPLGLNVVPLEYDLADDALARNLHAIHPNFSIVIGDGCSLFYSFAQVRTASNNGKWRLCLFVVLAESMLKTHSEEDARAAVKSVAHSFVEPFRSALLAVPNDHPMKFAPYGYWIPIVWDSKKGRVTLVGDAAHSLPPHRGQGLNNAVKDVFNFVEVAKGLRDGGLDGKEAVVQAFGDEVVERGAKEVRLSVEASRTLTSHFGK